MKINLIIVATLTALLAIFFSIGIAHRDVPGRTEYLVNDYAGVLDVGTKQYLESLLEYERDKGRRRTEIVVTIVKSLNGKRFDEYFEQYLKGWWRWPVLERHNRVQMFIITDEGRMRIGVGIPLENVINGSANEDIVNNIMLPHFKQNDYSGGTRAGVEAIVKLLEKQ